MLAFKILNTLAVLISVANAGIYIPLTVNELRIKLQPLASIYIKAQAYTMVIPFNQASFKVLLKGVVQGEVS